MLPKFYVQTFYIQRKNVIYPQLSHTDTQKCPSNTSNICSSEDLLICLQSAEQKKYFHFSQVKNEKTEEKSDDQSLWKDHRKIHGQSAGKKSARNRTTEIAQRSRLAAILEISKRMGQSLLSTM